MNIFTDHECCIPVLCVNFVSLSTEDRYDLPEPYLIEEIIISLQCETTPAVCKIGFISNIPVPLKCA